MVPETPSPDLMNPEPQGWPGLVYRSEKLLRQWLRPLPLWTLPASAGGACVLGLLLGYLLNIDLPNVRRLQDYQPPVITRLYSNTGVLVHQFAEERRILVSLSDIPDSFKNAIVATEDADFYSHFGVSVKGIARAAWHNLLAGGVVQGGSTLTQQLAKLLFLRPERTLRRKLQEAFLAMQIEKTYTKDEILEFYCNQIYMGHGRYGIEAASQHYFSKPASQLTLAEASTLAGIPQRPEYFSPLRNPEVARRKRDHVLQRMVAEKYLTREESSVAMAEPLITFKPTPRDQLAPYFVEEVRRKLEANYGERMLYQGGLEVFTTLDIDMQRAANEALSRGLHAIDRRQGFRDIERNLLQEHEGLDEAQQEELLANHREPDWQRPPERQRRVHGLVLAVNDERALVRIGDWTGTLLPAGIRWTKRRSLTKVLERGDITLFMVTAVNAADLTVALNLDQEPIIEGALVALDPGSGEVKAMIGGYDFSRSEFNRATQALRQSGSAFKPIVYLSALVQGLTPADLFLDAPTVFTAKQSEEHYQPENYTRRYYGLTTLREALENSRNIVSVRLLNQIGYRETLSLARRMGITSPLHPFPSTALGSSEVSLLEITSAYSIFPNQGIRVDPHLTKYVAGRDGKVREKTEPNAEEVVPADLAYMMTYLLEGVITDGTGRRAKMIQYPMAGKTGTTDDFSDAWFVGFTPSLACGVWVGFDQKQSIGSGETGSRAALPIWVDFFKKILTGKSREHFMKPGNVAFVPVDRETGLRASVESGCKDVILEAFARGSEPTAFCSAREHFRQTLPYFLQGVQLDEDGALALTPDDLLKLLVENPARLTLTRNHRSLLLHDPEQQRELPLAVLDGEPGTGVEAPPRTFIPSPERPVGVDDHIAVAVEVRSN